MTDGFANAMTGIGTERDKTYFAGWVDDPLMTPVEIEAVYANNDLAQTIVDKIVDDSLRDGFGISRADGTKDEETARYIQRRWRELVAKDPTDNRFKRGACWARAFGGGGVLLGVRGAGPLASPLDDSRVTRVEFVKDFDRQQMQPFTYEADGSVRTYLYTPVIQGLGDAEQALPVEVHASRVILFPGARTTNNRRRLNETWDLSVLQRVRAALLSFDGMWKSVDNMFSDASQAVFKMQGLIQALAEDDGPTSVATRLQVMDRIRSVARAIILDAGDEAGNGAEEFELKERGSLGGLDGVMQQYCIRIATAARMPLTVLLGMSPAGMDATGEADMILYFNTVDIYRKEALQPRIERIINLLANEQSRELDAALPAVEGEESEESDEEPTWCVTWPELHRPKPLDVATAENMRLTSAMALVDGQVVLAEELALSLKDVAEKGIAGLNLNLESRERAMKAGLEEVANREMGLGKMEAEGAVQTENTVQVEKTKAKLKPPPAKMSERKTPSKAAKRQV